MDVVQSAYRDDTGEIVDDLDVRDSAVERLVVLRNDDDTVTVRGIRHGDKFEMDFAVSKRQYTGLQPLDDSPIHELSGDVQSLLGTVGFHVESPNVSIKRSFDDPTETDSGTDESAVVEQ